MGREKHIARGRKIELHAAEPASARELLAYPSMEKNVSGTMAWSIGIIAVLAMVATAVLTLGISAIFWGPVGAFLCVGMLAVWAGRRRRLALEMRDMNEVKDPKGSSHAWPPHVIDNRLPQS